MGLTGHSYRLVKGTLNDHSPEPTISVLGSSPGITTSISVVGGTTTASDALPSPTWEEYYIGPVHGETPTVYTNAHLEGIEGSSVYPQEKQISVYSGECVRFQFSKLCEHWTSERHGLGKPPLLLLSIGGRDGRKKEMVPMDMDGYWWWLDVNAIDLGAPGEGLSIFMVTNFDGKDGRGLSKEEFLAKRGRVGMAFAGIIKWDLI
ncbi:hypothetical protein HYQ46_006420 [Verticillium longisporum]|nr:hypothetical protein HYQ46_006420 [Verticillium longisporum]